MPCQTRMLWTRLTYRYPSKRTQVLVDVLIVMVDRLVLILAELAKCLVADMHKTCRPQHNTVHETMQARKNTWKKQTRGDNATNWEGDTALEYAMHCSGDSSYAQPKQFLDAQSFLMPAEFDHATTRPWCIDRLNFWESCTAQFILCYEQKTLHVTLLLQKVDWMSTESEQGHPMENKEQVMHYKHLYNANKQTNVLESA